MQTRCQPHRQIEPCFYCEHGVGPFVNNDEWISAIQNRIANLERRVLSIDKPPAPEIKINEAIGVIRDYALGDIVMLAPALKALKDKYPHRHLVLLTRPELMEVLAGAKYLDDQLPADWYEKAAFYKTFNLVHAAETEAGGTLPVEEYLTKPRPKVFADLLKVKYQTDHFYVPVGSDHLAKLRGMLVGAHPPIIGLAPTCGSVFRAMPTPYVGPLIEQIQAVFGGTVVLLGKTREWHTELADLKLPRVVNLINKLSVGELIAAVFLMDVLVSPDTGTMHIAGALGVKCLCVMANNDPKIFSDFYPSVKTIQATEIACVPCHDRSIPCSPFPKGKKGSDCMMAMTPERITEELKGFYNGKNIAYLHDTNLDVIGGAEITTKGMIKAGREMGFNVRHFDVYTPTHPLYGPYHLYGLYQFDLIILSNIWRFPEETMDFIMQVIQTVPYIKYEHDHDGMRESAHGYPRNAYAEKIYHGAAMNIFVSPAHQADYEKVFLKMGPCTAIPELIDTAMFAPVPGVERKSGSILVPVPGKWHHDHLAKFMEEHPLAEKINKLTPFEEMPALYSQYEYIAHFPMHKWPCDRVIFEAALCGCKVMAGDIVQALSWGKNLKDQAGLRAWLSQVPKTFWDIVGSLVEIPCGKPGKKSARNLGVDGPRRVAVAV
jgi:ADP-heptose:LPS heptosyltransferase